ncbi:ABC1 family-domain-containing protein [Elsinoe ampelina]|uniref:ABC1 family-domain-containing protein n=1 Tax=Elsinoe ampelina TaxID=302913 RepID=A0A6A6GHZ8_9PEZI|nr:ABC1 family-domain-containing protein [Elsinoe ampelina]
MLLSTASTCRRSLARSSPTKLTSSARPLSSSRISSCVYRSQLQPSSSRLLPSRLPHKVRFNSQFQPLRPPSPSSLGAPTPAKTYRRTRRVLRRLVQASLLTALLLAVDTYFYDACLTRSLRTFRDGLITALDYKINFRENPPFADSLGDVHRRSAERLFHLLRSNGGLYLKIGQAIAMQSAILPPEFQKMFARMFDDAPQNGWEDVEKVIREDFGKGAAEVFGVGFALEDEGQGKGIMERKARASASVAQVHWARLADGREVAIKVQKREIRRQVGWDLWAFKVVAKIYTFWFDIPLYSLVPYISERLLLETDFREEAKNADRMRQLVHNEPRLKDRVYIPKVYHELSSKRIMTAEWIEGVRLWDREAITGKWQGGWRQGSPGVGGQILPPPTAQELNNLRAENDSSHLKPPRDSWRGPDGKGGLGLSYSPVMETMVSLFSAQMFLWGLVHCDPHPGNIFIRRKANGRPELVLIDHGLYITMSDKFRQEYASFWKALMTFDNSTIGRIVKGWGINSPDLFASATLMRPYTGGDGSTSEEIRQMSKKEERERAYAMQMRMRQGVREILGDEKKWPRELIFIGRNLRIVQGNNQFLGSPVNRVKITGVWASRALAEEKGLGVAERVRLYASHVVFRTVLLGSDLVWWWSRLRQWVGWGRGMDDDIEQSMKAMAKGFGIEMQHGVFEG